MISFAVLIKHGIVMTSKLTGRRTDTGA